MQITVENASETDTKLRGYFVGKVDGKTVCCCRGRKATRDNAEFIARTLGPAGIARLERTKTHGNTTRAAPLAPHP